MMADARLQWPRLTRTVCVWLTWGLAFFVPLGDIGRFGRSTGVGAPPGVTTVLTAALIGVAFIGGHSVHAFRRVPGLLLLLLFVATGIYASFPVVDDGEAVRMGIRLLGYVLVAISLAGLSLGRDELTHTLKVFAAVSAIIAALALLDYFQVVEVPIINDRVVFREIAGARIRSMTGPFFSQTTMAAHVALALPLVVCYSLDPAERRTRFLWAGGVVLLCYVGMLTYSRGLVLSAAATSSFVLFHAARPLRSRRVARLAAVGALAAVSLQLMAPSLVSAFLVRAELIRPAAVVRSEHDMMRLYAARTTLEDLARSPLGAGFTNPDVEGRGEVNVHSNLTFALRAGGIVGLLALLLFLLPMAVRAFGSSLPMIDVAVYGALLSLAVYGLAHVTIGYVFAWMLLGIATRTHAGHTTALALASADLGRRAD